MTDRKPTLDDIRGTAVAIAPHVLTTPVTPLLSADIARLLGPDATVALKLELFQHTSTFKARGAMANAQRIMSRGTPPGLTAASAGNHAIATAWAARRIDVPARVVMVKTANPLRVARAKSEGATVVLADDAIAAFATATGMTEIRRGSNGTGMM